MQRCPTKETIKDAGYEYVRFDPVLGGHVLRPRDSEREELWFANKRHASFGLIYKNTHLEFARGL